MTQFVLPLPDIIFFISERPNTWPALNNSLIVFTFLFCYDFNLFRLVYCSHGQIFNPFCLFKHEPDKPFNAFALILLPSSFLRQQEFVH